MHVHDDVEVLEMMCCEMSVDPLVNETTIDTNEESFSANWAFAELISTTTFLVWRKLLLSFLKYGQMVSWSNNGEHR